MFVIKRVVTDILVENVNCQIRKEKANIGRSKLKSQLDKEVENKAPFK